VQHHELIGPQAQGFVRAPVTIAELDLERLAACKEFHYRANLPTPQVVFRQVNGQRYHVKQFDRVSHLFTSPSSQWIATGQPGKWHAGFNDPRAADHRPPVSPFHQEINNVPLTVFILQSQRGIVFSHRSQQDVT